MDEVTEIDLGTYKVKFKNTAESDNSLFPLYSEQRIEEQILELRKMLSKDASSETQAALNSQIAEGIRSFKGHWFQRIDYPDHHISSTSDHENAYIDEGGLNTLNKKLSSKEASILRPYPKWVYIKPLLPDLIGKSVLELGSSNGFFSFRFSELGAKEVTGIEILKRQYESAVWSKEILGHKNITFLNTDFLVDFTIPKHDIVFLSEVHNHLLFPFYGLLRIISLAKEMVILDTGIFDAVEHQINLSTAWKPSGQLIYHSFQLSNGLISDFLNLIGIDSSRISRYTDGSGHHLLYVIDTKGLQIAQNKLIMNDSLVRSLTFDIHSKELEKLEKLQSQNRALQSQISGLKAQLQENQSKIAAMKTSKFWKIRTLWFKVKRLFGLGQNE